MDKRIKTKDKSKARSLINASKHQIEFTLTLNVNEDSASTIVRNIYESFRMLGEALLVNKGFIFSDHITSIEEIIKLDIDSNKPLQLISVLRQIRHKINYDGYLANVEEAKEAIDISNELFRKVYDKVMEVIEGKLR